MPNQDREPDLEAERREEIRRIYKEFGQNTRVILTIARAANIDSRLVVHSWRMIGDEIQKALHETGKVYGG